MQQRQSNIKDKAVGRWRAILPALGVPAQHLTGKHGPCPCCGGKDRFRWTDRGGNGSYFCNSCGPGDGIDLVMKINKVNFAEARKLIETVLPNAQLNVPKATDRKPFDATRIWASSHKIERYDAASKYLIARGFTPEIFPTQLRFHPRVKYVHDDKSITYHPAMVANFLSPDGTQSTVHYTYLTEDGRKADVPKPKKLAQGPIPVGGAVRLDYSAEIMGIAEGIETALAASLMFGMPVWSALSADGLRKWEPPKTAKQIIVYGDNDASYAGQHKAYGLAYSLRLKGFDAVVKLPDEVDTDWADCWMGLKP
jgi:putative DNA primase/helicase